MASRADIFIFGTHAGRSFFKKRSKASSKLSTKPAFTNARATCGTTRRAATGELENFLDVQRTLSSLSRATISRIRF